VTEPVSDADLKLMRRIDELLERSPGDLRERTLRGGVRPWS